jgi:hypothetical protein
MTVPAAARQNIMDKTPSLFSDSVSGGELKNAHYKDVLSLNISQRIQQRISYS